MICFFTFAAFPSLRPKKVSLISADQQHLIYCFLGFFFFLCWSMWRINKTLVLSLCVFYVSVFPCNIRNSVTALASAPLFWQIIEAVDSVSRKCCTAHHNQETYCRSNYILHIKNFKCAFHFLMVLLNGQTKNLWWVPCMLIVFSIKHNIVVCLWSKTIFLIMKRLAVKLWNVDIAFTIIWDGKALRYMLSSATNPHR